MAKYLGAEVCPVLTVGLPYLIPVLFGPSLLGCRVNFGMSQAVLTTSLLTAFAILVIPAERSFAVCFLPCTGHATSILVNMTRFTGPAARVRKYASPELKEYFEQHGRPTAASYRAGRQRRDIYQ